MLLNVLRRLGSCDFFLSLENGTADLVVTLNGEGADSLVALLNLVELDLVLFLNFLVLLDDRSGELNRRLNLLYYLSGSCLMISFFSTLASFFSVFSLASSTA